MQARQFIPLLLLAICWASTNTGANLVDTLKSCGTDIPLPSEIYVKDCDASPCIVRNGTEVYFEMVFTPARNSESLTAGTSLMLGSLEIPFALSEEDKNGCNGLIDSECPIEADKPIRYGLAMAVVAPVVGVTVDLQFYLEDSSGERSVCYRYSQTITAGGAQ